LPPDSAKIFLEKFNNRSKFPAVIVGKIIEPAEKTILVHNNPSREH